MACCCSNILELCRVSVCDAGLVKTGIAAPATGTYKLVLDYLETEVTVEAAIEEGQDIEFPAGDLNENYKYTGKIVGPDGEQLTMTVGEIQYNCLSFQTQLAFTLNPVD